MPDAAKQLFVATEEPQRLQPSDDPWSEHYVDRPSADHYRNCDAARRAGVAPMRIGEPGYRASLDRDGDGVACEPYRGR